MPTTITTAVLLFNYSEKQKASLKKLAPGINSKKLEGLINQLNNKAKRVAKKADIPIFQVNANSESGFGEQLYDAYQDLYDLGYKSVIGISNDCPDFNENDLIEAKKILGSDNFVLGPAKDGGLYLLGMRKDSLTKKEFLNLNWQTDALLSSLQQVITEKSCSTKVLTEKADMDTVGEFLKAFKSHHRFLINFKNQLFSFCKRIFKSANLHTSFVELRTQPLRAPPVLV